MDTTDPDIEFNDIGICSHCLNYDREQELYLIKNLEERARLLNEEIEQIKADGRGKRYDCIIGLSGGVDSSYVAYLVNKYGLRPLAVHVDNGWNSELAVQNIENIVKALGIDLYTEVLDWGEFRDLQKSFLKASTPDSEVPTDHAITATLYKVATREKIKHLILGSNIVTESIMPRAWSQGHSDWKYISTLQKKFGERRLKSFPHYSLLDFYKYRFLIKLKPFYILNYVDYNKKEALATIEKELGWRNYGGKHHESIYTRFFQCYILIKKFGIDKRKGHLSTLICSGQISREDALIELAKPVCDEALLTQDRDFVMKKLGFSKEEFDALMKSPAKRFEDYPSYENQWYYQSLRTIYKAFIKRK